MAFELSNKLIPLRASSIVILLEEKHSLVNSGVLAIFYIYVYIYIYKLFNYTITTWTK